MTNVLNALRATHTKVSDLAGGIIANADSDLAIKNGACFVTEMALFENDSCIRLSLVSCEDDIIYSTTMCVHRLTIAELSAILVPVADLAASAHIIVFKSMSIFYAGVQDVNSLVGKHPLITKTNIMKQWLSRQSADQAQCYDLMSDILEQVEACCA